MTKKMLLMKENIEDEPVYRSNVDRLLDDVKELLPEETIPVYDQESEILYDVLHALKIDDIELDYDADGLVARDDDNEWHGADFYHFLIDEAFVFEDDGSVLGIRPELLADFKALSEHNGVECKVKEGYPSANILVATKKDFETKNRKKFCGRIATGDYDAVIIGHSQFEKIPMSIERQRAILEQQLDEITEGIADLKRNRGEKFSVKQLEKSKKSIKQKLDKLNDQTRKDDVVTFEELGVDRLFIDESHYYKNLYLYTKMRNVGGIAQTEAQKSSDLFMKCRYLDEITGGRGTIFATGTPISNSMVELYTIQRYLQYNTLQRNGLQHFDAWASTFGETVTAVELTPEGTGYRAKTRFAKFYNLPELMAMFKEVADIKTADMLDLPVPEAKFHNIAVKPSEMQKEMVAALAERAEAVRGGGVDSSVDNMLKITNDGRKLALDQRMINGMLPDFEGSKINACVDNIYRIWEENADKKSAQLVFCDLSTPKNDGTFSVYNDIRAKLIERGIPAEEIKFIHEADTDVKKKELFQKTRKGEVRVLLGSTQKMGAGTNVQDRLIALHDVDCPWRPSDVGRILRTFKIKKNVEVTDNGKIII